MSFPSLGTCLVMLPETLLLIMCTPNDEEAQEKAAVQCNPDKNVTLSYPRVIHTQRLQIASSCTDHISIHADQDNAKFTICKNSTPAQTPLTLHILSSRPRSMHTN